MTNLVESICAEFNNSAGEADRFTIVGTSVVGYRGKKLIRRALENLINNADTYGDAEDRFVNFGKRIIAEMIERGESVQGPMVRDSAQSAQRDRSKVFDQDRGI